jgi:tetratricopeptide (TPR) repeat protein
MAYQSEIDKLEQRYEENPKQWFAALADAYRKEGHIDLALDYVRGGLEMRPNYASGYIVLGRCLVEKSEHTEAAQAFEHVLEIDAENIIALKSLSEIAELRGDISGAKRWIERLLEVDPMNDEARETQERLSQVPEEPPVQAEAEAVAEPEEAPAAASQEPGAAWAAEAMGQPPDEPSPVAEMVDEPAPLRLEPTSMEPEPLRVEQQEEPDRDSLQVVKDEEPFGVDQTGARAAFQMPTAAEELGLESLAVDGEHGAAGLAATSDEEDEQETGTERTIPLEPVETEEPPVVAFGDVAEPERDAAEDTPKEEGAIGHLDVSSFDDELAWDTGDRMSHELSAEDIIEAEKHHEDIAPAVEFLEGMPRDEDAGDVESEAVGDAGPPEEEAERETVEEAADFGALQAVPVLSEEALAQEASVAEQEAPAEAAAAEQVEQPEEPVEDTADEAPVESVAEPEAEPVPVAAAEPDATEDTGLPLIMPEDVEPERAEEEAPGATEPEPVVTETMAEVYAQQGLLGQARQTYEKLLVERPDDPALKSRLAELTERSRHARRQTPASRYSAAETGGPAAVAYLKQVFAGEAAEDLDPFTAPPAEEPATEWVEPTASTLESAFGDETVEPEAPGSPTVPAPDEVSLSSVFGESGPPQPAPATDATASRQPRSTGGVSFDEFYGKSKTEAEEQEEEPEPSENEGQDEKGEEFRDWLEGLKS